MKTIPRTSEFDSTLALKHDPYFFISRTCQKLKSDVFFTRIMLKPTICMLGKEATEIFYNSKIMQRKGAAPAPLKATLFGKGGLQTLDGRSHQLRKQMMMSIMSADSVQQLTDTFHHWLKIYRDKWTRHDRIDVYSELQEILCRSVCAWAGIPLAEEEVKLRTRDLTSMFDKAASGGIQHFQSRAARKRAEEWITKIVEKLRISPYTEFNHSPCAQIANFMDENGQFLDAHVAAVEILNLLRPTVAVSVYIVFTLHALYFYPESRDKIIAGDRQHLDYFIEEVRRFYPFFPTAIAKVKEDFEWRGFSFNKGTQVILDLFGTNNDPRIWEDPDDFIPDRFKNWDHDAFNFIPQGGGNPWVQHRCPGESLTIALMNKAASFFVLEMNYVVPPQNMELDYTRLPALPESRFVIENVEAIVEFPVNSVNLTPNVLQDFDPG